MRSILRPSRRLLTPDRTVGALYPGPWWRMAKGFKRGCCCAPDCPDLPDGCAETGTPCSSCAGPTPDDIDVTLTNIQLCTTCLYLGSDGFGGDRWVDLTGMDLSALNDTHSMSHVSPCLWQSGAISYTGEFVNFDLHDNATCTSSTGVQDNPGPAGVRMNRTCLLVSIQFGSVNPRHFILFRGTFDQDECCLPDSIALNRNEAENCQEIGVDDCNLGPSGVTVTACNDGEAAVDVCPEEGI